MRFVLAFCVRIGCLAVLAVGNATAVLKYGDRVLVDGSAGETERI